MSVDGETDVAVGVFDEVIPKTEIGPRAAPGFERNILLAILETLPETET